MKWDCHLSLCEKKDWQCLRMDTCLRASVFELLSGWVTREPVITVKVKSAL